MNKPINALSGIDAIKGITGFNRDLLLSLLKDCRYLYPSRRDYDTDYQLLQRATYGELYIMYKDLMRSLATGVPSCKLLIPLDSPTAIQAARQITGIFSKLDGPSAVSGLDAWKDRVSHANSFVPLADRDFCRSVISSILGPCPTLLSVVPRHGPGSVATGEIGFQKANLSRCYRKWLRHGGVDLLYLNENHWANEHRPIELLEHPITKVVEVPKDFMRKRIISSEPLEMQFLQQGVARLIMRRVERNTRCVNFTDQLVNRSLTSCYRSYATLDMSDASDTVSRSLVWSIFPADWRDLLFALRSHFAKTYEGIVPLRSYAPMGSALCFPVESLVFYVIVLCAMRRAGFSRRERDLVRIYGDDIIVPTDAAGHVLEYMREVGFKPNMDKCCINTPFRESCGRETWYGRDISISRPRAISLESPLAALPMVDLANRLYLSGYQTAASLISASLPVMVAIGHGPAYGHPDLPWRKPGPTRWNRGYQRLEQLADTPIAVCRNTGKRDSYDGLFHSIIMKWTSDQVTTPYIRVKRSWLPV